MNFDLLTKLLVPGLALVALIISELKDQHKPRWVLLGLTLFSLAAGFYPSVSGVVVKGIRRWRDERRARQAFLQFRRFVRRFGEFVDVTGNRNDTLYAVSLEVLNGNRTQLEKLGLPPAEIFYDFWCHLDARASGRDRSLNSLLLCVSAFNTLLNDYSRYCVGGAFERFSDKAETPLTNAARGRLNAHRERFVRFVDDYTEFLGQLDESLPTARVGSSHYFPKPAPL